MRPSIAAKLSAALERFFFSASLTGFPTRDDSSLITPPAKNDHKSGAGSQYETPLRSYVKDIAIILLLIRQ